MVVFVTIFLLSASPVFADYRKLDNPVNSISYERSITRTVWNPSTEQEEDHEFGCTIEIIGASTFFVKEFPRNIYLYTGKNVTVEDFDFNISKEILPDFAWQGDVVFEKSEEVSGFYTSEYYKGVVEVPFHVRTSEGEIATHSIVLHIFHFNNPSIRGQYYDRGEKYSLRDSLGIINQDLDGDIFNAL